MRSRFVPRAIGLLMAGLLAMIAMPSAALAAPGDQLWAAKYHGPGNHDDIGQAVVTSPDGSTVFITGETFDNGGYLTIAYDAATGRQLWLQKLMGSRRSNSYGTAIAVGPMGGRVYVTGVLGNRHGYDFGTIAYDATTGAQVWLERYDGPSGGTDEAWSVLVSPNGHTVYVTGESDGPNGSAATTIAYDSKTGTQRWISRQQFRRHDTTSVALALSSDGSRLYATGWEGGPSREDFYTVAYDTAGGAVVWTARYDGPADGLDEASKVALSPDGGTVIVVGESASPPRNPDIVTIAYDAATGSPRWLRRLDLGINDYPSDLAMSPSGATVAVTGSIHPTTDWDVVTTVYDTDTGSTVWFRRYDGSTSGDDLSAAAAYSPSGDTLYVVGQTGQGEHSKFLTIAYDAGNGVKRWLRRSANVGPFPEAQADDVVPAPDGSRVYVTGARWVNAINANVLTIAYEA